MFQIFVYFQGRSKSLTSIDTLDPSMPGSNNNGNNGGSSKSPGSARLDLEVGGRLSVPMWSGSASADHSPTSPGFHRRRKLSTASKVSTFSDSAFNEWCLCVPLNLFTRTWWWWGMITTFFSFFRFPAQNSSLFILSALMMLGNEDMKNLFRRPEAPV